MPRRLLYCFLVPVLFTTTTSQSSRGEETDIKATPARISSRRYKKLIDDKYLYLTSSTATLTVRFSGKTVPKITRVRNAVVESATDDQGKELIGKNKIRSSSDWSRIYHLRGSGPPTFEQFDVSAAFPAPARSARKLTAVKGSVEFTVSEWKTLSVPAAKLEQMAGKEIEDAQLKKLGLKLTVDSVKLKPRPSMRFKVTGDRKKLDMVLRVSLKDGKGKILTLAIPYGYSSKQVYMSSFRPLPANAVVEFDVETSRKEITVPFEFSDIELP